MLAGKLGFFGSGFDPSSLGTLVAWYDFSDNSTITLVSSLISQITNKSGSGPTLSQATAANRPSLGTIGGRQAAVFNGSSTVLFSNVAVSGAGTIITAFSTAVNSGDHVIASFSATGAILTSHSINVLYSQNKGPSAAYRFTGTGGTNVYIGSPNNGAVTAVLSSTYATPASYAVQVNGVSYTTTTPGGFASNRSAASVGAINVNDAYTRFLNGKVGEVLFYNSVLSASAIQSAQSYLSKRWGIAF
jgi:hypothetical protein